MTDTKNKNKTEAPVNYMAADEGHLSDKVLALTLAGIPVLLEGFPGTGKTAWVHQFAQLFEYAKHPDTYGEKPYPIFVLAGESMNPEDFTGYPSLGEKVLPDGQVTRVTDFATPRWAEDFIEAGRGLLFLDELRNFPPEVQASLLKVIQDKRLPNGTNLPEDTVIIAAQNAIEHSPSGTPLAAPLANRFAHLEWKPSAQVWIKGAENNWGGEMDENYTIASSLVTSFISQQTNFLLNVPKNESELEKPYPTWRTWQSVINVLAANPSLAASLPEKSRGQATNVNIAAGIVASLVGDAAKSAFVSSLRGFDVPTYQELIDNPKAVNWTTIRPGHAYIVLRVLSSHLRQEDNKAFGKIIATAEKRADISDVVSRCIRTVAKKMTAHNEEVGYMDWMFDESLKYSDAVAGLNNDLKEATTR